MDNLDNTEILRAAIDAKLEEIAQSSPTPPAWLEPLQQLGATSSELDRLHVYQAVRDSGALPDDASFHLISWQTDHMAALKAKEELHELEDKLDAIARSYGLAEGEFFSARNEPPEYRVLADQYEDAWDDLYVRVLVELGEAAMAKLYRTDLEEFDKKSNAGELFFHGAPEQREVPEWLAGFVETVGSHMSEDDPAGPLGFRFREEEGTWEVVVYPAPVELVGGAHDGEVVDPGFRLDVEGLRSDFDSIQEIGWDSLALRDMDGPHLWIEGTFDGHEILLKMLASAPDDEGPGGKVSADRKDR